MAALRFFQTLALAIASALIVALQAYRFATFALILTCLLLYVGFECLSYTLKKEQLTFLAIQLACLTALVVCTPAGFLLVPVFIAHFEKRYRVLALLLGLLPVFDGRLSPLERIGYILLYALLYCSHFFAQKAATERETLFAQKNQLRLAQAQSKQADHQMRVVTQLKEQEIVYRERQRMLQQIHDSLGHRLTGGVYQLEAAKVLSVENPEQSRSYMEETLRILRTGIAELRELIQEEAPTSEQISLLGLQRQVREFSEQHGLRMTFLENGDFSEVTPEQWFVLAANLEECLINSLKYGERNLTVVEISSYAKLLRLQVTTKHSVLTYQKGFGMRAMEERLFALGGQLVVDTTDGFRITSLLPKNMRNLIDEK